MGETRFMIYITGKTRFDLNRPSAVSLGKFDGMHVGHQTLLDHVLSKQKEGLTGVFFTFDQHPANILEDDNTRLIMTNEERRSYLAKSGLDVLIECPFIDEIIHMEPEDFIKRILIDDLNMKYVVAGDDFHFGYRARGNTDMLVALADKYGYEAEIVTKKIYKGEEISSSLARGKIREGDLETVEILLGRKYSVSGTVVRGRQLGRKIGIPTINVIPPREKLLPPNGVYTSISVINGQKILGISNIGTKPTVSNSRAKTLETHLFDHDTNYYGEWVKVELCSFIRPERKFDSVEALASQMNHDIMIGKEYFKTRLTQED